MRQEDAVVLGFGPMDDVHAQFEDQLAGARACADEDLLPALRALAAHLEAHFAAEDGWMRASAFPPGKCHMDEHAAVLRSADEVLAWVERGRLDLGRAFVAELERWFPAHADHLDSALAAWMTQRRFGGKPVVLRRTAAVH